MTQRNRQTENLIEDILGKDNAKFSLEASQYLRNLNFSAMDNYPLTDVYFKYEGDSEGTQEDRIPFTHRIKDYSASYEDGNLTYFN